MFLDKLFAFLWKTYSLERIFMVVTYYNSFTWNYNRKVVMESVNSNENAFWRWIGIIIHCFIKHSFSTYFSYILEASDSEVENANIG